MQLPEGVAAPDGKQLTATFTTSASRPRHQQVLAVGEAARSERQLPSRRGGTFSQLLRHPSPSDHEKMICSPIRSEVIQSDKKTLRAKGFTAPDPPGGPATGSR